MRHIQPLTIPRPAQEDTGASDATIILIEVLWIAYGFFRAIVKEGY